MIVDYSDSTFLSLLRYLTLPFQRKPPDEPLNLKSSQLVYFLKFLHASLFGQIQYLGSCVRLKTSPMRELFPIIPGKLHFARETQFLIFEEGGYRSCH
jgi:hypothetical protein